MWFARTLADPFGADRQRLRAGRCGIIEVCDGRLQAIHLRPWPKVISALEIETISLRYHENRPGDRCLLYYNQPLRYPNFLALKFVISHPAITCAIPATTSVDHLRHNMKAGQAPLPDQDFRTRIAADYG